MNLSRTEYPVEYERLKHFDSAERALTFARQTIIIYRQSVLNKAHHASTRSFRRTFIESYLELKKFVKEN